MDRIRGGMDQKLYLPPLIVHFGSYKCKPRRVEFNGTGLMFENVPVNDRSSPSLYRKNQEYHIKLPFIEIKNIAWSETGHHNRCEARIFKSGPNCAEFT